MRRHGLPAAGWRMGTSHVHHDPLWILRWRSFAEGFYYRSFSSPPPSWRAYAIQSSRAPQVPGLVPQGVFAFDPARPLIPIARSTPAARQFDAVAPELPPAQMAAVEAALMRNGAARETVRKLRLSGAAAAHAYDTALNGMPERLLLAAGAGELPPVPQMLPRRLGPRLRRLLPLAATVAALTIGLAGGYELRSLGIVGVAGPHRAEGYEPAAAAAPADLLAVAFESALLPALDDATEGQALAYAGKAGERGRIELGRRFTTGFGAECREFTRSEDRNGVSSRVGGLACRGAEGSWNVLLLPNGDS